jgi:hypothetical protein
VDVVAIAPKPQFDYGGPSTQGLQSDNFSKPPSSLVERVCRMASKQHKWGRRHGEGVINY